MGKTGKPNADMGYITRVMGVPIWRDLVSGGLAGLIGGFLFWWALAAQGMASAVTGLLGLQLSGPGVILNLLVSMPVGAST